jgi:hypothetical protein
VTLEPVTRESLREAARRALRPGLSAHQAVVVGYAQLVGEPLDPFAFDDAAVILRAERLLLEGLSAPDAVRAARDELVTWADTP